MAQFNHENLLIIDKTNFFELLVNKNNKTYNFKFILDELISLRKNKSLFFKLSSLLTLFWTLNKSNLAHDVKKAIVDPIFNKEITPIFSLIQLDNIHNDLCNNIKGNHLLFYSNNIECNIEIDFKAIEDSTNKKLFAVFSSQQIDYLIQEKQLQQLLSFKEIFVFGALPNYSHDLNNLKVFSHQNIDFQTLINVKKRNYRSAFFKLSPQLNLFQIQELKSLFLGLNIDGNLQIESFPCSIENNFISHLIDGCYNSSFLNQFFHLYFDQAIKIKNSFQNLETHFDLYIADTNTHNNQKIFSDLQLSTPSIDTLKKQAFKLYINQYNFFKLGSILQDIYNIPCTNFNVKDANYLIDDFMSYLSLLKAKFSNVTFSFLDSKLLEILHIVETSPNNFEKHTNPNENTYLYFLRLLGITCDHAFIGPQSIHIDITSRCNTKCTFCGYHTDLINDKPWTENGWSEKELDFNIFKDFIDDLVKLKSNEDVLLTGGGEPLMHPQILDMIAYLRQSQIYTILFTNGLLLKKRTVQQLVDLGLNKIYWSIHSASSSTWIMQHPGANPSTFDMVIDQMKFLVEYRDSRQLQNPVIVLVNAISAVNSHEVMDLVDLAIELKVDHLRLQIVHKHNEQTNHLLLTKFQLIRLSKQLPTIEKKLKNNNILLLDNISFQVATLIENMDKKEVINHDWSYNKYNQTGCFVGYLFTRTWVDGTMSYCCHDRVVDNLENGFEKVWNSDDYNHYRFVSKHYEDSQNILLQKDDRGGWLLGKDCSSCGNYEIINRANEALKISGLDLYTPIGFHNIYEQETPKSKDLNKQNIIFGENSYKPKEFMNFGGV